MQVSRYLDLAAEWNNILQEHPRKMDLQRTPVSALKIEIAFNVSTPRGAFFAEKVDDLFRRCRQYTR